MKPLYWNRILIPMNTSEQKDVWTEIEEPKLSNLNEFVDLFSRQVAVRKSVSKKKIGDSTVSVGKKANRVCPAKILDSKRARNVGILAKSLHIDFSEIEHAIYNFDTTIIGLEALQQIYEAVSSSNFNIF